MRLIFAAWLMGAICFLTFWGVIAYVALHFLSKYW